MRGMYRYSYSCKHNETITKGKLMVKLKEEIRITKRKIRNFYRMRNLHEYPCFNDDYNDGHDLPSYAESMAMYRKHSELFGISGRGLITIKDFNKEMTHE